MKVLKGILAHTDSPALTYHPSVAIADILPLNVDYNDLNVIGRARVYRDEEAGTITLDLHVDDDVADLTDPPVVMMGSNGTDLMDSEDGTTYALHGNLASVTVLTKAGLLRAQSSEVKDVEEFTPPDEPRAV
jgi:hypothetical protein